MANIIDQYYSTGANIRDAVKTLRANIRFSGIDKPMQTIVMASSTSGEGKSTLSLFLGIAMAEAGHKTLVVESDLRRPMLSRMLKVLITQGIVNYLAGNCTLSDAVIQTQVNDLFVMGVETKVANPVELIGSQRFTAALHEMKQNYDVIIFDTPPINTFIEAALIAAQADGTIIVLKSGQTDHREAKDTLMQLQKANAHILGVALNDVVKTAGKDYYYYENMGKGRKNNQKDIATGSTMQ